MLLLLVFVDVVDFVVDVIDPWKLPLKFGQNRVSNNWEIFVVAVFVVIFVVIFVVVGNIVVVDHRNLTLTIAQNWIKNCWGIADIEFVWVVVGGGQSNPSLV